MNGLRSALWSALWSARRETLKTLNLTDWLTDDLRSAFFEHVANLEPGWIELRHQLHAIPELSGKEFETTSLLAQVVAPVASVHHRSQLPGLWVDREYKGRRAGFESTSPLLALRGDIDGLPIQTELTTSYASRRAGCMHACGHDVHATTVVAALQLLDALAQSEVLPVPLRVRALFQPAEETSQGAVDLISEGALDGVERILALHVDPTLRCGEVGIRVGAMTASCDVFDVELFGAGGHSARPHLTSDLPTAVAHWITQLHARLPRTLDSFHPTVATVGAIHCGDAPNVVPTHGSIQGTLRSTDPATHDLAWKAIQRISRSTAELFDCRVEVTSRRKTPGVVNDALSADLIQHASVALLGAEHLVQIPRPSMGAEDFAFYLQHVPGAMFRLGVAGNEVGSLPLHTPRFDVDERAIAIGAQVFALSLITRSVQLANYTT